MNHPKATFTVEVTGVGAIRRFRNLIEVFQKLGSWGSSRTIHTWWDGDGPNKLKVDFDNGVEPTFTKEDLNKATNYDTVAVGTRGVEGVKRRKRFKPEDFDWVLDEVGSTSYRCKLADFVNQKLKEHDL